MRRRDLFITPGVALALPRVVVAQQSSLPVVGFLADATPEGFAPRVAGLRRGLSELGFVEGRTIAIEYRWARGAYDHLGGLAKELVRRQVAVIVTAGSEKVSRAAKDATATIPIVAVMAGDPVRRGLVESVNHPGGNLTVVSLFTSSNDALVSKRVELIHELVPKMTALGWLVDANILDYDDELHDLQSAAQAFGFAIKIAQVARESDLELAFTSLVRDGVGAILETGPVMLSNRARTVAMAEKSGVPMLYEWRAFVYEGGLMSYGTDLGEIFRQAGVYAGRILKGDKVGELPVVQQTKIELIVNLKTAKALGVGVPQSLLVRADEVIE
jgi:putative ABC transport system substrate-binding protein